jgi:hypothetical protein
MRHSGYARKPHMVDVTERRVVFASDGPAR